MWFLAYSKDNNTEFFIVINLREIWTLQGDFERYVASEIVYKPLQADSKQLIPGVPICLKAHHVSGTEWSHIQYYIKTDLVLSV